MTPDQFLERLGQISLIEPDEKGVARVNVTQASLLLRVSMRAVFRYIDGTRAIPGPVAAFLDYLAATGKSSAYAIKKTGGLNG